MKLNGNNLKIAIQKKGNLTAGSIEILKKAGLQFEVLENRLLSSCENFPLEIIFVRDDDIPEYVKDGIADLGILGLDVLAESQLKFKKLLDLGFSRCKLQIAVPKDSQMTSLSQLNNKRIATSFPNMLRKFLKNKKIKAEIIKVAGSVEIAPIVGSADAICDLVSSGSTLKTHDLVAIETVLTSQATLISKLIIDPNKQAKVTDLLRRITAVLQAQKTKYIMLNAPRNKIDAIARIIPGTKSPSVIPLNKPGWVAMHSVVEEDRFWETLDKLRSVGAQSILVLPIEKMII